MNVSYYFFAILLLMGTIKSSGQSSSSAHASTSVDIIVPVGTEIPNEDLTGVFFPRKEAGIIELTDKGIQITDQNGKILFRENAELPFFKVLSAQQTYSISISYNPIIINQHKKQETIQVESLTIFPDKEKEQLYMASDSYLIGAKFKVGPSQSSGNYTSESPYRVTVNFN